MKVTDIVAARAELAAKDDLGLQYFDMLIAKHTREVPDGLATRMRAALNKVPIMEAGKCICLGCSAGPKDPCEKECWVNRLELVLQSATAEACAALDAAPARVAELEETLRLALCALKGEVETFRRTEQSLAEERARADALARRITQEQAIARQRDLRLTDALNLLDECRAWMLGGGPDIGNRTLAARVEALTTAPTSVPEPTPDPRDAFVCFGLEWFASGELAPAQAEVFRQHLPGCAECRDGLTQVMQQRALIDGAKESSRG